MRNRNSVPILPEADIPNHTPKLFLMQLLSLLLQQPIKLHTVHRHILITHVAEHLKIPALSSLTLVWEAIELLISAVVKKVSASSLVAAGMY